MGGEIANWGSLQLNPVTYLFSFLQFPKNEEKGKNALHHWAENVRISKWMVEWKARNAEAREKKKKKKKKKK